MEARPELVQACRCDGDPFACDAMRELSICDRYERTKMTTRIDVTACDICGHDDGCHRINLTFPGVGLTVIAGRQHLAMIRLATAPQKGAR